MTKPNRHLITLALALAALTAISAAAVTAQSPNQSPDLVVTQPHYVDSSVSTSVEDGITTYDVKGNRIGIALSNIDSRDVADYGIVGGGSGASIEYNRDTGRYLLESSENGQYRVFWIVEQRQQIGVGNNTTTDTVRQRYTAKFNVAGTDVKVLSGGQYSDYQEQQEKFGELCSRAEEINSDRACSATLDRALKVYVLVTRPFGDLLGQWVSILLIVGMTAGGWLLILLFLGLHAYTRLKYGRRVNVLQKMLGRKRDLDERENEQAAKKVVRKSTLQLFNRLFGPRQSRELQVNYGNPRSLTERVKNWINPTTMKEIHAALMAQSGYGATVTLNRDRLPSDLGDDDPELPSDTDYTGNDWSEGDPLYPDDIIREWNRKKLYDYGSYIDGTPVTMSTEEIHRQLLSYYDFEVVTEPTEEQRERLRRNAVSRYLSWNDVDYSVWQDDRVDVLNVDVVPIDEDSDRDVIETLGFDGDSWDFDEGFVRAVAEVFEWCEEESYMMDDTGVIPPSRGVIDGLLGLFTVMDEINNLPVGAYKHFFHRVADELEPDSQISNRLDDAGFTLDD